MAVQQPDSEAAQAGVGKDEAIGMVGEQQHVVDPAVSARAVRKIDLFLIPAMIFGCASRPPSTSDINLADMNKMVLCTTTKLFSAQPSFSE